MIELNSDQVKEVSGAMSTTGRAALTAGIVYSCALMTLPCPVIGAVVGVGVAAFVNANI